MKKSFWILLVAILILFSLPAHASLRTYAVRPSISFSNYIATCKVEIDAASADLIAATVELWQGTTKIDEWSDSDMGDLSINGTASVLRYRTYRLIVNYTINGVSQPSISVDKYYG